MISLNELDCLLRRNVADIWQYVRGPLDSFAGSFLLR
jgi:hypothetical protein